MTRKNYVLISAAAAGAYWAWRRWGQGPGWGNGTSDTSLTDTSSARGETIFSNTPTATTEDVAHLGAAEGV